MATWSIQIPTWLQRAEVRTFICFVSTVLGLLCYALSSSFNSLYGKWNFAKLFIYIVLSIIICLATLFPKAWQHSPGHSFKVHMGFLVLTITAVYSFLLEEAEDGKKPDAYSLVSCVAFAMTTLSLSRQIHCGFEVDLLYFFLGALIGQLMKIKEWLAVAGLLFCYLLVILRSSLAATRENDCNQLPDGDHTNIEISIEALRQSNDTLVSMIFPLVEDNIEDMDDDCVDIDHNFVVDSLPRQIVADLHKAASANAAARGERGFSQAYISCRKEFLKECLSRITPSQKDPNTLQHENDTVGRWVKAANFALKLLVLSERQLCDRVFDGLPSFGDRDRDRCLMEIFREATMQLLSFADSFASRSPSMDRMFQNLYIFVALRDLIPEFQSLFADGQAVSLVNEAVTVQNKLLDAILASYKEMRSLIFDSEVARLVDGGVQLMTREAMNFVLYYYYSREELEPILQAYLRGADGAGTSSSFSVEMVSLLELLESKLESRSMGYEDPALRYFFMMNNRKHIENQIKKWDLGTCLRDDWVQNNTAKIQQNLELYFKNSWKGVLDCLTLGKELTVPNIAAESMKERLNLFYRNFKETCSVQRTWFVEDEQLREEVITYVGNIVWRACGNFIGMFPDVLATNASEYIRYGIDDIEARLKDLFRASWTHIESAA